ncbi:MAG: 30S ribosomal protein S9 [Bacteroidia bacterium]|jgi:small subunit ribosomal protein S9|nr:30S ribosomal protein S9 [Bacteroidia bacterium]
MEVVNTLGRRKSAVARIYLSEGKGNITINKREFAEYFPTTTLQYIVLQPLTLLNLQEKYDIKVNLEGGGPKGQAEALRMAISRALITIDPEIRKDLKPHGFLTRDPREVERKKPGQPKARKRFQFSKR